MTHRSTSSQADFDFFLGSWIVRHRRLKERLSGCTEWVEFDGTSEAREVLGGFGNIDDNYLDLPTGPYRAVTLRSFDTAKKQWAIWWLDGRSPWSLDTPVVGAFSGGVGTFYADDTLNETSIRVRFIWTLPASDQPRWEQAFSTDRGATWETNWTMEFTRRA